MIVLDRIIVNNLIITEYAIIRIPGFISPPVEVGACAVELGPPLGKLHSP